MQHKPVYCCMHSVVLPGILIAAGAGLLSAQPSAPAFDSASIKPAQSGARGFSIRPLPGRLSAQNVTLKQLIAEAWHIHDYQVSGGPKWADSDRYDLEAKAAGASDPPGEKQLMAMLQTLLQQRFSLTVRLETRDQAVYDLEPARGGPKLQPATDPSAPEMFRVFQRHQVTSTNAPLSRLTETLSWLLGRPVYDQTGLTGRFDYKFEWAPDDLQLRSDESPVTAEGALPSLGSALQEALGLRLLSKRGPVEIVNIEKAEKPAPN